MVLSLRVLFVFLMEFLFLLLLPSCDNGGGNDSLKFSNSNELPTPVVATVPVTPDPTGGGGVSPTIIEITSAPTAGVLNGGALTGNISISYTLTNPDSVSTNLTAEVSFDGFIFDPITTGTGGDGTVGLTSSPTGTAHTFVWNSLAEFPSTLGLRSGLILRLTAIASGSTTSNSDTSSVFSVNNNLGIPSAVVANPGAGPFAGTLLISYTLTDSDSDLINIVPEYSLTGAAGPFFQATQGFGGDGTNLLTSSPTGVAHTFEWQTPSDIAGTSATVRFRITPFDAGTGTSGVNTIDFTVDNTTSPVAVITAPVAGTVLTGNASITFDVTDTTPTAGTTALVGFSVDGVNFFFCTTGPGSDPAITTGFTPPATLIFVWDTAADFVFANDVIFAVFPVESGVNGVSGSRLFDIDNTGGGGGGFAFIPGTDKWQVNTLEDDDVSGFPDFDEELALANSGTNPNFSSDIPAATTALLSQTSIYYRNNPDGSLIPGTGMPISFQTGPGTGTAPAPGTLQSVAGTDDFSIMAIRRVFHIRPANGILGTAFIDSSGNNNNIENDSQSVSGTPLGVFLDETNNSWNMTPYLDTQRTLSEYMEFLGAVTAHEIGHSIGFDHAPAGAPLPPGATHNLMEATASQGPNRTHAFDNDTFNGGLVYMPGPSRCSMPLTPLQLIRNSSAIFLGRKISDSNNFLEFEVLNTLHGTDLIQGTIFIQRVEANHSIYSSPENTLFIASVLEKADHYELDSSCALFPIVESESSEWASLFSAYSLLQKRESDPSFRTDLLVRIQKDLHSEISNIRIDAMNTLIFEKLFSQIDSTHARLIMSRLIQTDTTAKEKCLSAQILTGLADKSLGAELIDIGLISEEYLLQGIAGAIGRSLGIENACDSLLHLLPRLDSQAKQNAIQMLGWMKSTYPLSDMTALIKSETNPKIVNALADALGNIASPIALPELKKTLKSSGNIQTKKHIYRAIGQIGTPEAKHWLRQELQINSDPRLDKVIRFSDNFANTLEIR